MKFTSTRCMALAASFAMVVFGGCGDDTEGPSTETDSTTEASTGSSTGTGGVSETSDTMVLTTDSGTTDFGTSVDAEDTSSSGQGTSEGSTGGTGESSETGDSASTDGTGESSETSESASADSTATSGDSSSSGGTSTTPECDVEFDDPVFEARVREALDQTEEEMLEPVTCQDMLGLTVLNVSNAPFDNGPPTSMGGLEYARNLVSLSADYTEIEDLGPLAELLSLTQVSFRDGRVTDLSPLRDHPSLSFLEVSGYFGIRRNGLSDLSALGDPPNLSTLWIGSTSVTDLEALVPFADRLTAVDLGWLGLSNSDLARIASMMPDLRSIQVYWNEITDVTPLESMTELSSVRLNNNGIVSLAPLVANPAIGAGDTVDVQSNCLDLAEDSPATLQLAALRDRGVTVLDGFQQTCD